MKFYRYSYYNGSTGYLDEWGDYISSGCKTNINLETFDMISETPKGYWLKIGVENLESLDSDLNRNVIKPSIKKKWVSKTSKKRFAYPTKEEALDNLRRRCSSRKYYLERDLALVDSVLNKNDKQILEIEKSKSFYRTPLFSPTGKIIKTI